MTGGGHHFLDRKSALGKRTGLIKHNRVNPDKRVKNV